MHYVTWCNASGAQGRHGGAAVDSASTGHAVQIVCVVPTGRVGRATRGVEAATVTPGLPEGRQRGGGVG